MDQADCFSHLEEGERQSLYQQIKQSVEVLQSELSNHQTVFSRHPDLYSAVVKVEREVLGWSAYRDDDSEPGVPGKEENPTICQIARLFLALESELEETPPDT